MAGKRKYKHEKMKRETNEDSVREGEKKRETKREKQSDHN